MSSSCTVPLHNAPILPTTQYPTPKPTTHAGGFAEREIRAVLSTDLAKHPAGHAIMAELAKAELAVDISAHTALAPHRTLRWTRIQAPALTASQVCCTVRIYSAHTSLPKHHYRQSFMRSQRCFRCFWSLIRIHHVADGEGSCLICHVIARLVACAE